MTVLLAGVVLISLIGRFGIALLLQKQAAAAHTLLVSTQDFKTSILDRDEAASSKYKRKEKERNHQERVKLAHFNSAKLCQTP